MDTLTASAASGIRARMESLELLANNLANQATAGFKADREAYNLYSAQPAWPAVAPLLPVIERQWTDFSQGTLTRTGNPTDVAISGPGFFAVQGPAGTLYTRNGTFHLGAGGEWLTEDGFAVLDAAGKPVRVDPSRPFEVSRTGEILQEGVVVARLGLVEFDRPETLRKRRGVYFETVSAAQRPREARHAEVHQGKLEGANLNPAEAAVRLVTVMRQFEMLQRALRIGSEMNRKAVEEVARLR